tara:strand:- start:313 stop:438 length:126 start_codon:yes stop_codon:yes gene_type:complete
MFDKFLRAIEIAENLSILGFPELSKEVILRTFQTEMEKNNG